MIPYLRPLLSREIEGPFHEDWFGMAWVTLLVPFVIWNLGQKSGPLDMHLGNYSYALYITHWPIIALMRAVLRPVTLPEALLILVMIAVVSVVFYLTVDRGWESARRKLISRLSSPDAVSG
jgi:peptidoglycan/LPS O-acetylase OafA/YrhL